MIEQEQIEKDYVDAPEAAKMLHISNARIRRLCLDGRFEGAFKAGSSWLIPRKAVENHKPLPPGPKTPKDILHNAVNEASKWKGGVHNDKQ